MKRIVWVGGMLLFLISVLAAQSGPIPRLDENGLQVLLRERNGKALFVNVWATWCIPCVQEFPDIVRLARDLKGEPVEFVAVSADDEEDYFLKVVPFLKNRGASFRSFVARIEGNDRLVDRFDPAWGGAIPASFVFDEKGNRIVTLIGKQSYHSLRSALQKVLPPSSGPLR